LLVLFRRFRKSEVLCIRLIYEFLAIRLGQGNTIE
jgi:hypothetical protein